MVGMQAVSAAVPLPLQVDSRDLLPWSVVVVPGAGSGAERGPCGPRRILSGPRETLPALLAAAKNPRADVSPSQAPSFSQVERLARNVLTATGRPEDVPDARLRVGLHRHPGLLGVEGDLLVAAAEAALSDARVPATVRLRLRASTASLEITGPATIVTASAVTAALQGFTPSSSTLRRLETAAKTLAERRRAVSGALALERVDRFLCFGDVEEPPFSSAGASLRAALHGPVSMVPLGEESETFDG